MFYEGIRYTKHQSMILISQLIIKTYMAGKKVQKYNRKSSKKGVYRKYSYQTRKSLIYMVDEEKRTLAASAKELGICQTTARLIVSTWRGEERVFQKKSDKVKRLKRQAKKRANERRRQRPRQRQEIEEGGQREEIPNGMISQKIDQSNQNNVIQDGVPQPQIAENAEQLPQLVLQPSISYQLVENEGLYYLQPIYIFATQASLY